MDQRLKQQTKKYILSAYKDWKKKKGENDNCYFISIRGKQNFEDDAEINPIEIKIENDKIQNMFEKYKKTLSVSLSIGYFFQVLLKMTRKKCL